MADDVPLRAHIDRILDERDRRYEQRFLDLDMATKAALAASEKAIDKAEVNAQAWRDGANEWRGAMTDRERNFASNERLQEITDRLNRSEGRSGGLGAGWTYLLGVAALVSVVVSLYAALHHG